MKHYNLVSQDSTMLFSYKGLPVLFFVTLHALGYTVEFTGNKIHPYQVRISESEFMSCVELSEVS